jgi:holo-[acyl-carrier protein] synthase
VILGTGTDLIDIRRIERALARFGHRFARRVLVEDEYQRFCTQVKPAHYLAKRFAAKEAFSKAMGTGFRYPVTLQNISVVQNKAGKPSYALSTALSALMKQHDITGHYLTITDEKSMACAVAILEK